MDSSIIFATFLAAGVDSRTFDYEILMAFALAELILKMKGAQSSEVFACFAFV